MITTRRDPDTMSITEAIALASSLALGTVIWLNGLGPWPAERGASVVIVVAFALSVALHAAAHAGARAAVAVGLVGTVAGAAIGAPFVVRTGLSATGLAAISTFGSAFATLCLATVQTLSTRRSHDQVDRLLIEHDDIKFTAWREQSAA